MTLIDDLRHGTVNKTERARPNAPSILVIDDDPVHRMIICKLAAKIGFEAVEAETCGDVVRLTAHDTYDCVTLDLSLGERLGTEVLLHFSICRFRSPIIILSGADAGLAKSAFEFGQSLDLDMVDLVSKPVSPAELRERLADIAEYWHSKRQSS